MKLCKLVIKDFQQFKHLELDFTHPETGKPLEQVCFIGSNGTGKSTILQLISRLLRIPQTNYSSKTWIELELELDNKKRNILVFVNDESFYFDKEHTIGKDIQSYEAINKYIYQDQNFDVALSKRNKISQISLNENSSDILLYVEAESDNNMYKQIHDVPQTNLNEAYELNKGYPYFYLINQMSIQDFWKILVYNVTKREESRNLFENKPESLAKTKKQLIDEFDKLNPKILDNVARLWNKILAKAGLEFDTTNARLPIRLTDNLKAYIRLKSSGQLMPYSQLSTGIRNFIFRIGHIYSLYFNREIKRGFLLVDEPENSLFPDFLLDLIDVYKEATTDKNGERNTQMFFATHNPIVAAQFEPYERIILEWTDTGDVVARRGTAPLGDDPNDLLVKDFEISSLMPKPGIEMWEKYLTLKRQLRTTSNASEKEELVTEILEIGKEYNFPRDQPKV